MIKKIRNKQIIVEAVHLTEELFWQLHDNGGNIFGKFVFSGSCHPPTRRLMTAYFYVDTLKGKKQASIGDWLIRGINNEFSVCNPDVFEKTYEVDDGQEGKGLLEILEGHCKTLIISNENIDEDWVKPFLSGVNSVYGRIKSLQLEPTALPVADGDKNKNNQP